MCYLFSTVPSRNSIAHFLADREKKETPTTKRCTFQIVRCKVLCIYEKKSNLSQKKEDTSRVTKCIIKPKSMTAYLKLA